MSKFLLLIAIISLASILIIISISIQKASADDTNDIQWHKIYRTGPFIDMPFKPTIMTNQTFILKYAMINGTITKFDTDHYGGFSAQTQSDTNTTLYYQLPRNFPYKTGEQGTIDEWTPMSFMDTPPPGSPPDEYDKVRDLEIRPQHDVCFYTFQIPIPSGNHNVEFGWTNLLATGVQYRGDLVPNYCIPETIYSNSTAIPEFPFASPILLISFVSVIVFYSMKFDSQR